VQATAMTPATTATQRTAEMPETVLTATSCEFLQKFANKLVRTVKKYKEKG